MSEPLISIRHVTQRFPGVTALDDVSLDISAGEFHAIVGENGAGKSTLMKILSACCRTMKARLFFAKARPLQQHARCRGGGHGHHSSGTQPGMTCRCGEISFSAASGANRLGLLDDRGMEQAAGALLAELECRVWPDQPVRTLRVGDQQLVEIAKALTFAADVLIMDEPTSALTEAEVARLDRVIARCVRRRGVTILYISHKLDEVFRLADRITVLRDGRLVRTLRCEETIAREVTHLMSVASWKRQTLLSSERRSQPGRSVCRKSKTSRSVGPVTPGNGGSRDITFSLARRGEIVGIAGLMGAGRTELLECLFGASTERKPDKFGWRAARSSSIIRPRLTVPDWPW